MTRHDCDRQLLQPPDRPSLRPCCVAAFIGRARSTVLALVEREGLPCHVLSGGERRRLLTFSRDEVQRWIDGRRERQLEATLDGQRYTRTASR